MPFDPEFWTQIWGDFVVGAMAWLPRLLGAIVWLLLGWGVARLAQYILASLLRRLGLDRISERVGATQVLTDAGLEPSASRLIARLVYWIILLVFVLGAAESLGLQGVVNTLEGLVAYLPSVLAAALIVLIGGLIARVVGDAVGALSRQAGVRAGAALGQGVRYVLLVFVIILALEQLGIQTTLLTTVATVLIAATALALALAFGLGSRELARNIMAGLHARESFREDQQVAVDGHAGRLVSIGPVKTVIDTDAGLVSLPNVTLTEEAVTVIPPGKGS